MSYDTVLRIKRKRTDESLTVLLTTDALEREGKKRRVWQLSRSSDSRGIPVPIASRHTTIEEKPETATQNAISPPRFSVRKRKASETIMSNRTQRVFDLERESKPVPEQEIMSLSDNEVLNSMLSDYLSTNDITQSSSSSTDEDYVYDIYYPQATTQAIEDATAALQSNYGLLEHFDWDATSNLVVDDDSTDSDGGDSEDSNAEDWIGNEYPDEEDSASNHSGESFEILGSDNENDETFDRNEWD